MKDSEYFREIEKRMAKDVEEYEKALKENPLLQYSTSQLKEELRRRKRGE